MPRVSIVVPDYIADELDRRSEGIGKRRAILEALCLAWDLPAGNLPMDQRRKGSDAYIERDDYGWHDRE